ncbi:MAG: hypothetical protein GX868_09830 [Actinobacteria bacterium]|nr:hypothetical protein [Actinomycetota bacterium]
MDDHKRLAVVVNSSAGSANEPHLADHLRECFEGVVILDVGDGDLIETLREAATYDIMGIVGGDGSVNAAVEVALETGTPLAVVPGGTLNHFARDIALESMETTQAAIAAGRTAVIDVGLIDGAPFVNTASFGSYPELVDERERRENRLGKWPALAIAMGKVMRTMTPTAVSINGRRTSVWLFFAGNCRYDPPGLAPLNRARLDDGLIDLRWIDASVPFGRTRTFLAMLTGPRGRSRAVKTLVGERFEIVSHEGPLRLARDGETFDGGECIVIEKHPKGVQVYVGWADR